MEPGYELRQALRSDEENIAAAWREAYSDYAFPFSHLYPNRFRWMCHKNPFLKSQGGEIPMWIITHGHTVATWVCSMEVSFELAGHTVNGTWPNTCYTLRAHRRKGLALDVQRELVRAYPVSVAIAMTRGNRRIYHRIGGGNIGRPLFFYLKLLKKFDADTLYDTLVSLVEKSLGKRLGKVFRRIGNFGLKQILTLKLSLLFKIGQKTWGSKPLKENTFHHIRIENVAEFGEEADYLWAQAKGQFSFAGTRSSDYLNWRYVQHPQVRHRRFVVRDDQGDIVGILVYRICDPPELSMGVICELLLKREDVELGRYILAFAERQLRQEGVDMILCGASTNLQRYMLDEQSFRLIFVDVPLVFLSPELEARIPFQRIAAGDWLISLGDDALDQVRIGNQPSFSVLMRLFLGKVPGFWDEAFLGEQG